MTIAEISKLPLNEKIEIMEAIWEDLRSQAETVPVPDWHKDLLDARQKAVEEGREKVHEWNEVRKSLGANRA
jgi:putative addiction module component (TIGR02574 family)